MCYYDSMKAQSNKKRNKKWLALLLGGLAGILLILAAIIFYAQWQASVPKPLGDKLEYIGKVDYGCIGFCDSPPGSTYYYATDMKVEQLIGYFKGAEATNPSQIDNWQDRGDAPWFDFVNKQTKSPFTLIYYYEGNKRLHELSLSVTSSKQHVIELDQSAYGAAEHSL